MAFAPKVNRSELQISKLPQATSYSQYNSRIFNNVKVTWEAKSSFKLFRHLVQLYASSFILKHDEGRDQRNLGSQVPDFYSLQLTF